MSRSRTPSVPRPSNPLQRSPSSPDNDGEVSLRKRLLHVERELAITRRYLHRLQREHGQPITRFFSMPRYGKLRYRPVLLGYAPSAGARSGLPFDDEFGDHMCDVFGLTGLQHLLVNFKVRNVFLHQASDLTHDSRNQAAADRSLAGHVAHHLFDGRIVLVVGQDARRACRIVCEPTYMGPVEAPALAGAARVIVIPEIGHPKQWGRTRREQLWTCLAFAMAASRLPCDKPIAEAWDLMREGTSPAWRSLLPTDAVMPETRTLERGLDLWMLLAARGLAAPPDLTRGAWWPTSSGGHVCYATGGVATLRGTAKDAVVTVHEYEGGGLVYEHTGLRGECRRLAEIFMLEGAGWNHPFIALDKRIEELRR